jgi:hypothetical protein
MIEPLVLTDKTVTPTDELIFSIIGENRVYWQELLAGVHQKYPDAMELWNYYNDGKNWLFRMIWKKKTLFWIGVHQDTFRVTFYFGDKAEPLIESSAISASLKEGFKSGKRYGKIRSISMKVQGKAEVENALKLVDIRVKT